MSKVSSRPITWIIAVISAVVGGFMGGLFGSIGGGHDPMAMIPGISGLISGFVVGYYYVHFTLKDKTKIIRNGTIYGGIAGLLSGISVWIPGIVITIVRMFFDKDRTIVIGTLGSVIFGAIVTGALFGVVIGLVLGLVLSPFLAFEEGW